MNKKDLVELLNQLYSTKNSSENKIFNTNNINKKRKAKSLILMALLKIVSNAKPERIETYINKKITNIDIKLTILRAKIAEINNRKNEHKMHFASSKNDYSLYHHEIDYSKIIQDINIEIIDLTKQIDILQERKRNLIESSKEEIINQLVERIKKQSIKLNLQGISTYKEMPIFQKISTAIKKCNPDEMIKLAKKQKVITEEYNINSKINLVTIGTADGYYPSLKLLTDLNFKLKGENYLKTKEDCECVLSSITKFQTITLRDIKQLLETEYTSDKLSGLSKMSSNINYQEELTDYDFLRLHQGKYDNNLAIQLRGYEQIYEEKQKQTFKTENTMLYINNLKKQILVLRKKIYKEITGWYLSQKLFNKVLDFNIDALDQYEDLKERYKKIVDQMSNYKNYIIEAQNILEEVERKYQKDKQECEIKATDLGLDSNLIDDMTSDNYLSCIDYIEREKVKKEIKAFINGDKVKKTASLPVKSDNEILADKLASSWTAAPSTSSLEYENGILHNIINAA